jgi:hypothetical protein
VNLEAVVKTGPIGIAYCFPFSAHKNVNSRKMHSDSLRILLWAFLIGVIASAHQNATGVFGMKLVLIVKGAFFVANAPGDIANADPNCDWRLRAPAYVGKPWSLSY